MLCFHYALLFPLPFERQEDTPKGGTNRERAENGDILNFGQEKGVRNHFAARGALASFTAWASCIDRKPWRVD
jgi:hypothetical protein